MIHGTVPARFGSETSASSPVAEIHRSPAANVRAMDAGEAQLVLGEPISGGFPWVSRNGESHGIPWNLMESHGIPKMLGPGNGKIHKNPVEMGVFFLVKLPGRIFRMDLP